MKRREFWVKLDKTKHGLRKVSFFAYFGWGLRFEERKREDKKKIRKRKKEEGK